MTRGDEKEGMSQIKGHRKLPRALVLKYQPGNTTWREFSTLFGRLTVLKILRGFECPQTKQEAFDLTQYHKCFDKMGVNLMAVSEQTLGGNKFLENGNWTGELYLDLYQDVCRLPLEARINHFLESQTAKLLSLLHIKNSAARPQFLVGGTYIVSPDHQILFSHEPKSSFDDPNLGLILYLCRSWTFAANSNPLTFQPVSDAVEVYRPQPRSSFLDLLFNMKKHSSCQNV